ncbi:quinone-dependent dihydroorotate dehydrogenase [Endozoicomonas sp. SCSIO W0465]|uniref:quinone-dependent dihydroorotate dehydrogenase n=1 Tax=Endozoicomonas sp. SCSIO W0465 TaxID=2918516 RepID=UPI002075ED30|nr:quinone-dependent dihydroorotate dehydrogenase [Endozoicomonas sp. SCSIO W0465]USE34262.1 quinone-dependent dihydroorotate dehydrogenase [Endozoicomonas sp. SCSIO W0465]
MYKLTRSALFCLSAETAHDFAMEMISAGGRLGLTRLMAPEVPSKPREVMGLTFNNPVGLAAGLDKNGECIDGLGSLGFGFLELGTVTPVGQPGNPKPRMFRIPEREALINRMGFNNLGVDQLVANVQKSRYQGVIGINIGKNLTTAVEDANRDYLICLRKVYPHAGYVAVNLSSPNTPGLRKLQYGDALKSLLAALKEEQASLAKEYGRQVPLAIKIAPDMTDEEMAAVAAELVSYELDGVIATNTTLDRDKVSGFATANEAGGLSGRPLSDKSTAVIRLLAGELSGKLPIIGVGGIMDAQTAADKIKAGASLVQIYSGFIYQGPGLIREAAEAVYSVGP